MKIPTYAQVKPSIRLLFLFILVIDASTAYLPNGIRVTKVHQNGKQNNNGRISHNNMQQLQMISLGDNDKKPQLPRDVKAAVSNCRAAVQSALQNRLSRIDVEMPVGTKFGVEKSSSNKISSKRQKMISGFDDDDENAGAPTREMLNGSDRELARLFMEMFLPVGPDRIAVVFSDQTLADEAKKKWKGDPDTMPSKILYVNKSKKLGSKGKKKVKKTKGMGFAAIMEAEVGNTDVDGSGNRSSGPFRLPDGIEVALFVAPKPKDMIAIERTCSEVGMDTLVILLNARLGKIEKFGTEEMKNLFMNEFEPVFSLCAANQEAAPGCLLYRSYPEDWILARKPKVGQPKTMIVQSDRPDTDQCRKAYDEIEVGDVEKGIENVVDNIAGWFR